VYANGIAAAYTFFVALSSGSDFLTRIRGSKPCTWLVFVLDQVLLSPSPSPSPSASPSPPPLAMAS
jgi:hypothetical protein